MRSYRLVFLLLAVASLTAAGVEFAFAQGGGPDSLGCHTDRKRGDYHCHRGELAGRSFASPDVGRAARAFQTLRRGPRSAVRHRLLTHSGGQRP